MPSGPSIGQVVQLREAIGLGISAMLGIPAGLQSNGSNVKVLGEEAGRMFERRCKSLRSLCEIALTECYHRMGLAQPSDLIQLVDELAAPCRDLSVVSALAKDGLLDMDVARSLVAEVLRVDHCEKRPEEVNAKGGEKKGMDDTEECEQQDIAESVNGG